MQPSRRGFLIGLGAVIAAPAIVRAESLMRIKAPPKLVITDIGEPWVIPAPEGWLPCYGQQLSRSRYADLFRAIGTTFGHGDMVTTFNLPDLRGRVQIPMDYGLAGGSPPVAAYEHRIKVIAGEGAPAPVGSLRTFLTPARTMGQRIDV
jgi:hypothetical protein